MRCNSMKINSSSLELNEKDQSSSAYNTVIICHSSLQKVLFDLAW